MRALARYFFNIRDGQSIPDTEGSEHPDLASVRAEAVDSLAEMIKGRLLENADIASWIVQVTDEAGYTVMILSLGASIHTMDTPPA